ncbi:exostoses (multiple)-like 2 [Balamuthia mandrillaris]
MVLTALDRMIGRPHKGLLLLLSLSLFFNWYFFFLSPQPSPRGTYQQLQGSALRETLESSASPSAVVSNEQVERPAGTEKCIQDNKQVCEANTKTISYDGFDLRYGHIATKTLQGEGEALTTANNKNFPEDPEAFREAELKDLQTMMAFTDFQHRRFLWHNSERFCRQRFPLNPTDKEGKVGWVTATINDAYVIPAIALAHSIRKFSCLTDNLLAIISSEVSKEAREVLTKAGWTLLERPPLDCQHQGGRPDGALAKFPGEHMRFHVWNLTEYDRLVYLDCDIMLLDNIDEIFHLPLELGQIYAAHFAPPDDKHELKTGINSGLLVLRPSSQITSELLQDWRSLFKTAGCMADQPFLRRFFDQPRRGLRYLPYAYNVRRNAYHPMRLFHMAGFTKFEKLWLGSNVVSRKKAADKPIQNVPADVASVWWFMFYDALDAYGLQDWWAKVASKATSQWGRN